MSANCKAPTPTLKARSHYCKKGPLSIVYMPISCEKHYESVWGNVSSLCEITDCVEVTRFCLWNFAEQRYIWPHFNANEIAYKAKITLCILNYITFGPLQYSILQSKNISKNGHKNPSTILNTALILSECCTTKDESLKGNQPVSSNFFNQHI